MTSQRHFSTLRLLSGQWRWRETGILVTQLSSAVETFWKQLQALMQAPRIILRPKALDELLYEGKAAVGRPKQRQRLINQV